MKREKIFVLCLLAAFCCTGIYAQKEENDFKLGAERMEKYLPLLEGKKVGIVANQTSVVRNSEGAYVHLLDTLLARGVNVVCVFSPEHGFRGNVEAGASVKSGKDLKTGVNVISLYGKNKKPSKEQVELCDIVLFDLQDVGCRFYTYISTLHYVMEACCENNRPVIVLDRPNPNDYVDGPVLQSEYKSFVGMHCVPVVYGLTIGEYALMINGEGWLKGKCHCDLTLVPLQAWYHDMEEAYRLPVAPSPNLPTAKAVALYPSLCLFEGTTVSVGRGTDRPFEIIGFPNYEDTAFCFIPRSIKGVSENPPYKNEKCYGKENLEIKERQLNLSFLTDMYSHCKNKDKFFNAFFDKLAGTNELKEQIKARIGEEEIRKTWSKGLDEYEKIREKYVVYKRN